MTAEHHDLIIVGTGSGNAIPAELADRRIAIVERSTFGGTCMNVGCIPSKMFVYSADVALHVREASRHDVSATLHGADWPAIRDRVFGRIDPIISAGQAYRAGDECPTMELVAGTARFVGHKTLAVGDRTLTADHVLLGTGARPWIPEVVTASGVPFHTSDTVMRVDRLPDHLVVLGGGYIAAELGHVFEALGSRVTIINRGHCLLRAEDADIAERFTDLARERFDLVLGAAVESVRGDADEVVVEVTVDGERRAITGDTLLVATGRVPNSELLDLPATGLAADPAGRLLVDDRQSTAVEGIWAIGDLTNHHQLKHLANAEARTAFHNIAHPDDPWVTDHSIVPHAVFANPQVASVGLTEAAVVAEGLPFVTATVDYASTAYGWAMEDTTSFCKLVAHAQTRRLLGAHLIGPQAPTLIQVLVQGMRFGQTVDEMAREQMWIHPALTEVIENALLAL